MNDCYCTHQWTDHILGNDPCHKCFCRVYVEWDTLTGYDKERHLIWRQVWKQINGMRRIGKCRRLTANELAYRKSKWKVING